MANENASSIDKYGRIVIPKQILEKLGTKEVVFVYDEKMERVRMVPVRK
jgi:AbrB family looped-hinge helix DNA binding protein